MLSKDRLLHPATLISIVALVIAASGIGYAAATIGTPQIKNSAVTTPKIRTAAVTNGKIAANAIATGKIRPGGVTNSDLAGNSVGTGNIANRAVTSGKLATNSVTTGAIANGAVQNDELANGSVSTSKIASGAITGPKIANGTITAANLAPGAALTGQNAAGAIGLQNNQSAVLITVAGLATVEATCPSGTPEYSVVSATAITMFETVSLSAGASTPGAVIVRSGTASASGVRFPTVTNTATGGVMTATLLITSGSGPSAKGAAVEVALAGGASSSCIASAHVISG
ncbi:MAG: hypothetical protein AB7V62_09330 [Thermoleophilia bacterium]